MARDKQNPPVTCSCGAEAEPHYEEVDIGVGVQRFQSGWECPEHGGICGTCGVCGVADRPGYTHESWCSEHPGETVTAEAFDAETDRIADKVAQRFTVSDQEELRKFADYLGVAAQPVQPIEGAYAHVYGEVVFEDKKQD